MTDYQIIPQPRRKIDDTETVDGKYLRVHDNADVTGCWFTHARLSIPQDKVELYVGNQCEPFDGTGAKRVRINIIRQSAGWKWIDAPESTSATQLISIEQGGQHWYALSAVIATPIVLNYNPVQRYEPRMRPETRGLLVYGDVVGTVSMRGQRRQVFDRIMVETHESQLTNGINLT